MTSEKFKNEFKKRLYSFVLKVIKFTDKLPKTSVNEILSKQLIRSSSSVIANYIEARSASSKRDYINFFNYSLKSVNESKVWLSLLIDTGKGEKEDLRFLIGEIIELSNILAASILTLKGKRK